MSHTLRTVSRTKLYTSIVDQIVEGIRSEAFPSGSALPPERTLAEQLGVSRGSVREAIRVMEHAGVLEVRIGSGTYVAEGGLSKAATLRAHTALLGESSPLDVMIARRALEPTCAEQAATNRRTGDLELLRRTLKEYGDLIERGESPLEVDFAFHVEVAAATRNDVLVMLVQSLVSLLQRGLSQELILRTGYETDLEQHRAILAAIEASDGPGAARAMREHLDSVERTLLGQV